MPCLPLDKPLYRMPYRPPGIHVKACHAFPLQLWRVNLGPPVRRLLQVRGGKLSDRWTAEGSVLKGYTCPSDRAACMCVYVIMLTGSTCPG